MDFEMTSAKLLSMLVETSKSGWPWKLVDGDRDGEAVELVMASKGWSCFPLVDSRIWLTEAKSPFNRLIGFVSKGLLTKLALTELATLLFGSFGSTGDLSKSSFLLRGVDEDEKVLLATTVNWKTKQRKNSEQIYAKGSQHSVAKYLYRLNLPKQPSMPT